MIVPDIVVREIFYDIKVWRIHYTIVNCIVPRLGEEDGAQLLLPPIDLAKEVKVSDEEVGDDRLGDEEWSIISAAK